MISSTQQILPPDGNAFDSTAQPALVAVIAGSVLVELEAEAGSDTWLKVGTISADQAPFYMPVRLGRWRFTPDASGRFSVQVD